MIGKKMRRTILQLLLMLCILIYGYISKHESRRGKQVILLMIPNGEDEINSIVKAENIKK